MASLMGVLGDPHLAVPVLHIAGTKGKGSTAAMAAAMLRASGLNVGLTTSPHLLCARERIRLNDVLVDEAHFAALEARVHAAAEGLDPALDVPSFFERMVAMAFCAFADAGVDVAVVEVGLGGRLDATNVVHPRACAVTTLGLDHTEFLGPTLVDIAREKAGIFKGGVPAVTVPQADDAHAALMAVAVDVGAPLQVVEVDASLHPSLAGLHQQVNASLARALVRAGDFDVDDDAVARGLDAVRWPGRYETVAAQPLVIIDGAHDGIAAEALAQVLHADERLQDRRPLHLVLGFSSGHEAAEVLLPLHGLPWASATTTTAHHPRAVAAADLVAPVLETLGMGVADVVVEVDVPAAVAAASARAREDGGVVVVTGSLFVAGEARAIFVPMPRDDLKPIF